jgi:5-methylthioribose kinase
MTQTASANPAQPTPRARFQLEHPGLFYLDPDERDELAAYLKHAGVLPEDEQVQSVSRAGEGNMNCTVRATTPRRSFIVKQARPWVEKYPQFDAPWDRALREIEFYQLVGGHPGVADRMPRLLHADRTGRLLVLEDLGVSKDLSGIYRGAALQLDTVDTLADYLNCLHHGFRGQSARHPLPNREMRALNHAHIFEIPLQANNGLALDELLPGLEAAADRLRSDRDYVSTVHRLGTEVYLADGDTLLHGDFFPGSFLDTPAGPKVIDPEFACFGRPEVDGGMFLAHMMLGGQSPVVTARFLERYRPPAGYEFTVMLQLAGIEVMRRLMGYAQLPLACGLDERRSLLVRSRDLVLHPSLELAIHQPAFPPVQPFVAPATKG